jgi:23S rRNA (uracil1939-C5)-methyltransferase
VRIGREKARVAWGELDGLESSSPERVQPACPRFGTCGGCQWQHVPLARQREAKRDIVARALGRPVEIRDAGPPLGYRDRARLIVDRGPDGRPVVGFRGRRSHEVVDVESCPVLSPAIQAALPAIRARARALPPGTEVALQAGREGEIGVVAPGWEPPPAGGASGDMPPDGLVDVSEDPARPLRIAPGRFAQVGVAANRALVAAALAQVGEAPGRLLELFAGSGNFTRHLVLRASRVVATDGDRDAVAAGRRNVPAASWRVALRPAEVGAVETVFLDPPRAGIDPATWPLVLLAERQIVYVSCDPQTLGRDARRLADAGFRLVDAVALDLMPQTHHVEVVARFERARGEGGR